MLLFAGLLVGAGAGATVNQYIYQNNGFIVIGKLDIYIDNEPNPTSLDWGTMLPSSTYYVSLIVVNKGNTKVTVTLTTVSLPEGWIHTWALNNTVWQINESKSADLYLIIPADAVGGNYAWTTILTATEV